MYRVSPDCKDSPVFPPAHISDTVLIVDDDEMNRAVLTNIFSPDYSIEIAENGEDGLSRLEKLEGKICAILLDVVMPVMDGMTVLKELFRKNLTARIPVFLITGETDNHIIRKAYDLGVMDVISKPISSYIVKRRINSVIELFMARQRLAETVSWQKDEILQQARQILKLNTGMIESLSTAIEFRSGESESMSAAFMTSPNFF